MTTQDILELAARCEAATGPNYALEIEINRAVKGFPPEWPESYPGALVSNYTASLDAAMTLVPEGCCFQLTDYDTFARVFNDERGLCGSAEGYTAALALTAAALKARAHTKGEE